MSPSAISSTVLACVLALAIPVYAADTGVLAGSDDATVGGSTEPTPRADAKADWLTAPPDPSRHNLCTPATEWAVALALTIPLFTLAPSFVHTGTVATNQFVEAWTRPPAWDTDGPVANYVLHPIMGAEAYLTVRNRDYGPLESFLFSTAVSVGWEYLFESWAERPSAQDLLITSNVGSLQGELRFQLRRRIARWSPSLGRDTLLVLVDPVEALHRYVGKTFLKRSDAAPADIEMIGSSLNVGPDQARVTVSMQF